MKQLAELVRGSKSLLVFTGAGMSTGSGIPDFRGPQGIWKKRQPVYLDEFLSSHAKRVEYWDYKLEGYQGFREARPNAAHLALARLELDMLVTQNIDGLHHASGINPDKILELHGTNRLVSCLSCGHSEDPAASFAAFEQDRQPPKCACGGWLKPATISFGQSLDETVLARAFEAAERADLVLALGSTLSVHPAASVPLAAARRGVPYVIVNQGPTDQDDLASLRLEADLCQLLPELVAAL